MRAPAVGCLAALLAAVAPGVRADNPLSPGLDEQRGRARQYEPAALTPPGLSTGRVVTVKIRFYADPDYRAGLFRWADRVKAQLSHLNQFLEPGFGVRLEAESFRR